MTRKERRDEDGAGEGGIEGEIGAVYFFSRQEFAAEPHVMRGTMGDRLQRLIFT